MAMLILGTRARRLRSLRDRGLKRQQNMSRITHDQLGGERRSDCTRVTCTPFTEVILWPPLTELMAVPAAP